MRNFKLGLDRAISRGTGWQLLIIAIIIVVSLGISYISLACTGDWTKFCNDHDISKVMLPIYLLIDDNLYSEIYCTSPAEDGTSVVYSASNGLRLICGITFLIGVVFFNGAIIAILSDLIKRRVDNYRNGYTHYLKKGHYLIMGYDDMVPSIITDILAKHPNADILLLTSAPAEFIHEKLRESVARKALKNIVVNYGHRISTDFYQDIHMESAAQIFVVGDRRKSEHDAVNVECVESIYSYLKAQQSCSVTRITCVFENLDTYVAFCTTDIFSELTKELNIEFVPYNFYTGWAKQVFVRRKYSNRTTGKTITYPAVYGLGIKPEEDKFVHLVFVGTSTFAVSFAREAAQLLHFPNSDGRKCRTRITFIDNNMKVEMQEVITRYRHLFEIQSYYYGDYSEEGDQKSELVSSRTNSAFTHRDFLDVEFEFINGDIFSAPVQQLLCEWHRDQSQYLSLFLAMSRQSKNFAIGMNLPDELYEKSPHDGWHTPIFIRQDNADNFVSILREQSNKTPSGKKAQYYWVEDGMLKTETHRGRYAHLYPFGMNNEAFYMDETVLRRAKLVNYLYEEANYDEYRFTPLTALMSLSDETIWSKAQEYWKTLATPLKWSNVYAANSMQYKLVTLRVMRGLAIDDDSMDMAPLSEYEVKTLGFLEHNRWNVEKLLMGFRKPLICEDKYENKPFAGQLKTNKNHYIHHDIRPYDDLDEVKILDEEFMRYMPWIIEMTRK